VSPFTSAAVLAAVVVVLLGPFSQWLARAPWVSRAPHASILLWQCTGLSAMVAGIGAGLALAVEQYHIGFARGVVELVASLFGRHPLKGLGLYDALGLTLSADLFIVLLFVFSAATIRTVKQRTRHRRILELIAGRSTTHPDLRVLSDDRAVAYCLPGIRPRIVLSDGTIRMLDQSQLLAVIEHERGHARERHGLVMLPMAFLGSLFPWIPYARVAPRQIALLLEMAADDFSTRRSGRQELASALIELAPLRCAPRCALSLAQSSVPIRVRRLLSDSPTTKRASLGSGLLAGMLLCAPVALMAIG
jgi:Zn-dependent protease with chaperone function